MATKWKFKIDNKLRGAYGETDTVKKIIRISKKAHKSNGPKWGIAKKDDTLLNTIVHEMHHKNHPNMHEKTVIKETRKKVQTLSPKQKRAFYATFGL